MPEKQILGQELSQGSYPLESAVEQTADLCSREITGNEGN